jgi:RNA polymerase sigma-70 factor (ECF subfamily)
MTAPYPESRTTRATLLARLAEGVDPRAWREFHDRYSELIRNFARRTGQQPADCDDIVQEVLLILARTMPRFEYDPARGRFRGYLKTITVRAIFRRLRQTRRVRALEDDGAVPADPSTAEIGASWEIEWRRHHVRRAMRRLESEFNDSDRLAFAEYALSDRPAGDVASELGMTVNQVYQAKSRILRRLSEVIAEQTADED